jgi:Ca-activated chloride channel family protein
MRRVAAGSFALLFVAGLACAAPAHANGILVTDASAPIVVDPPDRRPPTSLPPLPMPPPPERARWQPVRLKSHRVTAVVNDQTAEVTVEQTFRSDADRQLEGTYLFPLPEGAAVGKFAMTMGGKMVEGAVIEANEARRVYQSIVSRRRDPGLLEYMGRGLFQARVFPIMPREDLTIRLSFSLVLRDDLGTIEFRYPLASDRLNGQPVEEVVVDVKVESAVDIKTVWSPSHEVAISRDGERKARVSFERSGRRQDKDFLLYVGRSPEAVGFSFLSTKQAGEDGTFFAVFAPRQTTRQDETQPKDVVYVLDTSGSMAGEKMEQGRRALKQGVQLLRNGDRFNVIGFSTGTNPFRDGLVEANAETRAHAMAWIDGLQPVGGTNIDGALQAALGNLKGDRLAMVVFITDGKPTVGERDTEALLKKAREWNAAKARVFTFGVGNDLDVALLDRLAEGTNGTRDYVAPGEDLELVTGRFFTKVDRPALTDVTVELGSGVYDVYPQRIPDLFAGSQVVLFGRYRETGERTVILRGKMGGREVVHEHRAAFAGAPGAGWLPRLWASRKVAFLLDDIRLHGQTKESVDEVIRLATRYAIVTPYTAGLVVEDGELEGRPALARGGGASAAGRGFAEDSPRRREGGLRLPSAGAVAPPAPAPSAPGDMGAPTPTGAPPPTTPPPAGQPMRDSEDLKKMKEAAKEEASDKDDFATKRAKDRVQAVGSRSFVLRQVAGQTGERWVDTAWDGKKQPIKVEAYSEDWMALLAKGDEVAKVLALGERVLFVLGDAVYEVVPAATK